MKFYYSDPTLTDLVLQRRYQDSDQSEKIIETIVPLKGAPKSGPRR